MYEEKSPTTLLNEFYKQKEINEDNLKEKEIALRNYLGPFSTGGRTLKQLETIYVRRLCQEFSIR